MGFSADSWLHCSWSVPHGQLLDLHELHSLSVTAEGQAGEPGSSQRKPSWLGGRVEAQGPSLNGERVDEVNHPTGPQWTL